MLYKKDRSRYLGACRLTSQPMGAGNVVLRLVATRRLVALATPPLFLEYEDVLKRSEHRLAHGLAIDQINLRLVGPSLVGSVGAVRMIL